MIRRKDIERGDLIISPLTQLYLAVDNTAGKDDTTNLISLHYYDGKIKLLNFGNNSSHRCFAYRDYELKTYRNKDKRG